MIRLDLLIKLCGAVLCPSCAEWITVSGRWSLARHLFDRHPTSAYARAMRVVLGIGRAP